MSAPDPNPPLTYELVWRQQRFFLDWVDLYKPDVSSGEKLYPETATYENVPCFFEFTPEVTRPDAPGRTKLDDLLTDDRAHFHSAQEIGDTWAIHMKNPDNANYSGGNGWWFANGNPQSIGPAGIRSVATGMVMMVRGIKPAEIT